MPIGLQHRIKDIVCTPKPVHTKITYKAVLKLDTVHYHDVLIIKKRVHASLRFFEIN